MSHLQIEEGKYYKLANGDKAGPAIKDPDLDDVWKLEYKYKNAMMNVPYSKNGHLYPGTQETEYSLAEEWKDEYIQVDIDKVKFDHYKRGVARIWDTYRI